MKLEILSPDHQDAFLQMVEEYRKSDPESLTDFFAISGKFESAAFKKYVVAADKARQDWRPSAKSVSITRFVLIDDKGKILGNGLMRFPLDEKTEKFGGNLEFNIPPSLRESDFDAWTLNGMLFEAVRAGMARVLVTVEEKDLKRRSAIERNRGELEDVIDLKVEKAQLRIARYWIRFR